MGDQPTGTLGDVQHEEGSGLEVKRLKKCHRVILYGNKFAHNVHSCKYLEEDLVVGDKVGQENGY